MQIYLAGNDDYSLCVAPHALRYPFRLCSYLKMGQTEKTLLGLERFWKDGSAWIMDSGMFSLMFGSKNSGARTYNELREYALRYVDLMVKAGWCHPIIECDVQLILGKEENLRLREEVFKRSGLPVIYVWHYTDGLEGLRELAREHEYIALPSGREFMCSEDKYYGILLRLIQEVRRAGQAKIHMLGCSSKRLVHLPADSCDSSTWISTRYTAPRWLFMRLAERGSLKYKAWLDWCRSTYPEEFWRLREDVRVNASDPDNGIFEELMASAINAWLLMDSVNQEHLTIEDKHGRGNTGKRDTQDGADQLRRAEPVEL